MTKDKKGLKMNETMKIDWEWIQALHKIDSQVAFTGDRAQYVDSVLAPLLERADREAALAVKLRNLCEELKPGSSSHL